jgi:excinuclease UvrABC ATPase subunit
VADQKKPEIGPSSIARKKRCARCKGTREIRSGGGFVPIVYRPCPVCRARKAQEGEADA